MIQIFNMRLLHFKRDYQVLLLMTVLTLFFVFIFNLSSGSARVRLGWIVDSTSNSQTALYDAIEKQGDFIIEKVSREAGEIALADMKLDYLIQFEGLKDNQQVSIQLLTLVEDIQLIETKLKFRDFLTRYYADKGLAESIDSAAFKLESQLSQVGTDTLALLQKNIQTKPTIALKTETFGTSVWQTYDNKVHSLIGFSLMFSMFTLIFSVTDVLTDLKNHTWGRLNTSPVALLSVLIGYFAPSVLLGFAQLAVIFIFGSVVFQIDFSQHILSIMGLLFLFSLTVTGLAILMSSLLKTRAQAGAISVILINGTSMLGGCMWPLAIVESKTILALAQFVPQKWAIEALEGITMNGLPPNAFGLQVGVLIAMAVCFTGIGMALFTRRHSIPS